MSLYKKDKDGKISRVKDPNMDVRRASTGRPVDNNKVTEEDQIGSETQKQQRELDQRPDETEQQYRDRLDKLTRSKMSGAEVMERDHLMLKVQKQERDEARLKREPICRGVVTGIENNQARIKYDPLHPLSPNTGGEITIRDVFEPCEDGKRRLHTIPPVGSTGLLLGTQSIRDGITLMWSFTVVEGLTVEGVSESDEEPSIDNVKILKRGTVAGIADGGDGSVIVTIDLDGGGSTSISMLPDDVPAKGSRGVVDYNSDGDPIFLPDTTDGE